MTRNEQQALIRLIRTGIVCGSISAVAMAVIFIVFSLRIERALASESVAEQNKIIASQILIQVERSRIEQRQTEMRKYFDQIELLAKRVLETRS